MLLLLVCSGISRASLVGDFSWMVAVRQHLRVDTTPPSSLLSLPSAPLPHAPLPPRAPSPPSPRPSPPLRPARPRDNQCPRSLQGQVPVALHLHLPALSRCIWAHQFHPDEYDFAKKITTHVKLPVTSQSKCVVIFLANRIGDPRSRISQKTRRNEIW